MDKETSMNLSETNRRLDDIISLLREIKGALQGDKSVAKISRGTVKINHSDMEIAAKDDPDYTIFKDLEGTHGKGAVTEEILRLEFVEIGYTPIEARSSFLALLRKGLIYEYSSPVTGRIFLGSIT